MPVFEYKGLDNTGKKISGKIDGEHVKIARAKLRKQGIYPIDLTEQHKGTSKGAFALPKFFQRVSVKDVAVMTRQLATLVKANIPLVDALTAITDQVEHEKLKLILTNVREQVNEGSSLAQAMAKHPEVFSNLFVNMVKAGETSGTLDSVLLRLAEFTESSVKLRNKVVGSMTYPLVMVVVGAVIVGGLFVFVIPKITQIFADMEQSLPLITQIVIAISDLLRHQWYLVIGGIGLIYWLARKYLSSEKGKQNFDRFILKVPLFGKLVRMISISRFASTLSTLLHGGVPLLVSMDIVKNVIDNHVIKMAVMKARENISEGQSIAGPLRESGEFPPMVTHMISIGEKTGELENMLTTVSQSYDNEVETTLTAMTQILEPLMIVFMGVVVGTIVMAVLLPILELNNIAGGG